MEGRAGKILDIDLSTDTFETAPLNMEMARRFLAGRGDLLVDTVRYIALRHDLGGEMAEGMLRLVDVFHLD